MLRVGLTGSIGVGKSFVTGVFADLGCRVVDADATARDVVVHDSAALREVVAAFGQEVLQSDGTLDRSKLGGIVFGDSQKRAVLNSILHPYIIAEQDRQLQEWEKEDPDAIAIVDAALMIESGSYKRFDKVIVVYCCDDAQLERVMTRNKLSREDAESRIRAQMPQEEKKKFADYLIDTSDGFEAARIRTRDIYKQLVAELKQKQLQR
ncbi:MAG: dephospho-CoA kinase [Pyrinomonadaceae bacterium]